MRKKALGPSEGTLGQLLWMMVRSMFHCDSSGFLLGEAMGVGGSPQRGVAFLLDPSQAVPGKVLACHCHLSGTRRKDLQLSCGTWPSSLGTID